MTGPSWLVDDMLRVEETLLHATRSGHPLVDEAATHLLNAGGKRLRPALVMISSRAGRDSGRSTLLAAAAVELVHLATLYHDDVIDDTDTRRGVPTVHAKWGTEVAVLSGDYLFARGCSMGAEAGGKVARILADAISQVCEGQLIETERVGDPSGGPDAYIATIQRKTAALFRAACELGCTTSGASPEARSALRTYGLNLGLAFQVVDDLLDVVGDPRVTGKEIGSDLRAGVFTLPVLLAAQRDGELVHRLGSGERSLDAVFPTLVETAALGDSFDVAQDYGEAARHALADFPRSEWREHLDTIVTGVLAQVDIAEMPTTA